MKQLDKNENLGALVKVTCQRFTNELHFGFHLENRTLFERFVPTELGIDSFMEDYTQAVNDEDTAIEQIRRSADTKRIAAADAVFDESYSGMNLHLQSCLKHYDPLIRRSAENLKVVFAKYGNIGKHQYREELVMSRNLLTDLRERAADVTATGLAEWMNAHEQTAIKLRELIDTRSSEIAGRTTLRVSVTRRNTDSIFHRIISRLEARINLNGLDYVPGFVAAYNTHATEYKNALAQHLGRLHSKNKPDEEKPEEEKPTTEA